MGGFIVEVEKSKVGKGGCADPSNPICTLDVMGYHDDREIPNYWTYVMGYHDDREIPNYWTYAKNFVPQDHLYEPAAAYSVPSHLFMVSEWSALCTQHNDPASCANYVGQFPFSGTQPINVIYGWTDLTYLLHQNGVTWAYYVVEGTEPDCVDPTELSCIPSAQCSKTQSLWNPLPAFDTVVNDQELSNIKSVDNFYAAAAAGTLPSVSWVVPSQTMSEHPSARISDGQAYVTSLVNAVMSGPNWPHCAIFITWGDWGGFYDHSVPPTVDLNGYGIRVPGLTISPYAKSGMIDHQILSFDAYAKFIEDLFLGGQRLDPATDGRPDPRPTVRENVAVLGDLMNEFDFSQPRRPPLLLQEYLSPRPAWMH
jgi:phospholipase C